MVMVFGVLMRTLHKFTKVIIVWIKSLVMGFMSGKMDGFTKEISKMIYVMDLVNYMREINAFIVGTGRMVNKQIRKLQVVQEMYCLKTQCQKLLQRHHRKFITENLVVHKSWEDMRIILWDIILKKEFKDKKGINQQQKEKLNFCNTTIMIFGQFLTKIN